MTTKVKVWGRMGGAGRLVGTLQGNVSRRLVTYTLPTAEVSPRTPEEQFQSQQQVPQEVIPAPTPGNAVFPGPAPLVPQDRGSGLARRGVAGRDPPPSNLAYLPTPTPELAVAGDLETEPTEPGPLGKLEKARMAPRRGGPVGFAGLRGSGMLGAGVGV